MKPLVAILYAALASALIIAASSDAATAEATWVAGEYGRSPAGTVRVDDRPGPGLAVCRVEHLAGLHPGWLDGHHCRIGYGGDQVSSPHYEVMLEPRDGTYVWGRNGRPVIGGYEAARDLVVCRARSGGAWYVGKVVAGHCNFGLAGAEVRGETFELLVEADGPTAARAPERPLDQIPFLVRRLSGPGDQHAAIKSLRRIGADAVPALREALVDDRDPLVRQGAARALGDIGGGRADVVDALLSVARTDGDAQVRWAALHALLEVGPQTRGARDLFIQELSDRAKADPVARGLAAYGLGRGFVLRDRELDALRTALEADGDRHVRFRAALALGVETVPDGAAVAPLVLAMEDEADVDVRWRMAESLAETSERLARSAPARDADALDMDLAAVRQAEAAARDAGDASRMALDRIDGARRGLQTAIAAKRNDPLALALIWLRANPQIAAVIAFPIICFGLWSTIWWLRPLWLLRVDQALAPVSELSLPGFLGGATAPLRTVLLLRFFSHSPRVLDAWVAAHAVKAREGFSRLRTVADRGVRVPAPVVIDGDTVADLRPEDVRPAFRQRRSRILIWGEGGSGKTTLACLLGRWLLSEDAEALPAAHMAIPVLLETNVSVGAARDEAAAFREAVQGRLEEMLELPESLPARLFLRLAREGRIVVIVDHLSEMDEATRALLRPADADFPFSKLIVTSRLEEPLDGVAATSLQPLRVRGDRLSSFMEAYLTHRGARDDFTDQQFFAACGQLSATIGAQDTPILFVKLFADDLIARRRSGEAGDAPTSLADLVRNYVVLLNGVDAASRLPDAVVLRHLQAIAWACVRRGFRPDRIPVEQALAAVEAEDPQAVVDYLAERLRLIILEGPVGDRVRLSLDPVTEHLAALHLTERLGDDAAAWRERLAEMQAVPDGGLRIRGFARALRDAAAEASRSETPPPAFVVRELDAFLAPHVAAVA